MKPLTDEELDGLVYLRAFLPTEQQRWLEKLMAQAREANRLRELVRRMREWMLPETEYPTVALLLEEAEAAIAKAEGGGR